MSRLNNGNRKINEFMCKNKIQIILFLSIFFVRCIYNLFLHSLTLSTGRDEIGTIAGAAFFAGKDWSSVISTIPYYGWGYSMLMAPAFLITDNVRVIYQIMLGYNAVLLAGSTVMCFNIMYKYFKIEDKKLCVIGAIASNFFYHNLMMGNMIINENAIVFLVWVIMYLMVVMQDRVEHGKKNNWQTLALGFVMCYGMTIHIRFIMVWVAVAIVIIANLYIKCRGFINLKIILPVCILGYLAVSFFNDCIQKNLWLTGIKDDKLVNSMDSIWNISSNFRQLLNTSGLKAFFQTILGQTFIFTVFSGSLLVLFIIKFIFKLWKINKYKRESINTITDSEKNEEFNRDKSLFVLFIFIGTLLVMTFLLMSVASINDVISANMAGRGSKWFIYQRYWAAYASMAIFICIIDIIKDKIVIKKELIITVIISIMVIIGFNFIISTKLNGVNVASSLSYLSVIPFTLNKVGETFTKSGFLIATFIGLIWLAIIMFLIIRRKIGKLCLIITLIFVYIFSYKMTFVDYKNSKNSYEIYSQVVETINKYKLDGGQIDRLYVNSSVYDFYSTQFIFHDFKIIALNNNDLEKVEEENYLIITNEISENITNECIILYENTVSNEKEKVYLIANGGVIKETLLQEGIECKTVGQYGGIEKMIFNCEQGDIKDIGIPKIQESTEIEQDINITEDIIQSSKFCLEFMFNNPKGDKCIGNLKITLKQKDLKKEYNFQLKDIVTKEKIKILVESSGLEKGKATIILSCSNYIKYNNIKPYTSNKTVDELGKIRVNGKEYQGILFFRQFIPTDEVSDSTKELIIDDTIINSKCNIKIGACGKSINQKFKLSKEMLEGNKLEFNLLVKPKKTNNINNNVTVQIWQTKMINQYKFDLLQNGGIQELNFKLDSSDYLEGQITIKIINNSKIEGNDVLIYGVKSLDSDYRILYNGNKISQRLYMNVYIDKKNKRNCYKH